MAFPVPSHLPRAAPPPDISTRILTKVGEATSKTLSASLAATWLSELDEAIGETKTGIHARIAADLPAFDAQLECSRSVQTRLSTLSNGVAALSEDVSNPDTGLVPSLLRALTAHSSLAQQAHDASTLSNAISHLTRLRREFESLDRLAKDGKLARAVEAAHALETLLDASPDALAQSDALKLFHNDFRAVKDRVDEQLGHAYSQAVSISQQRISIQPSVSVPGTSASIALPDIFASFTPASLERLLGSLKRDISTYVIDFLLAQPASLRLSSSNLDITPAPPSAYADHAARLSNLSTALNFLSAHLLPALPTLFAHSLAKPLTQALLNDFLQPLLPSSVFGLKAYEVLTRVAVDLEDKFIVHTLGQDGRDREVRTWVERVPAHAERRAAAEALEKARTIVLGDAGSLESFELEVSNLVSPNPEQAAQPASSPPPPPAAVAKEDDWGLDDDVDTGDGWGLDDDKQEAAQPEHVPQPITPSTPHPSEPSIEVEEDTAADAWGWEDDDAEPSSQPGTDPAPQSTAPEPEPQPQAAPEPEPDAWDVEEDDDPWGEPSSELPASVIPAPEPAPAPRPAAPAKRATRLEKLASKGKTKANHAPHSSTESTLAHAPPPTPASPSFTRPPKITVSTKPASRPQPQQPTRTNGTSHNGVSHFHSPAPSHRTPQKERFSTTARARTLVDTASASLRAASEFSRLGQGAGEQLRRAASGVLDVFRVLAPVLESNGRTKGGRDEGMLRSNDCVYLAVWARSRNMAELADTLEALGSVWFDDAIDVEEQKLLDVLAEAEGFIDTAEQETFDACEGIVASVLSMIRDAGRRWKNILTKQRYFTATGALVDAALARVLEDVLALPDITEDESHRLSELCRVMNALEGLFIDAEDPEQPSRVVAHVPSWLKFSYLSELLEASLADVDYLFNEGALVDFERDELVRLVRALFAESPARETLVARIQSAPEHDAGA
ncbi:hypothetical protein PENSPDRAFT_655986 [Peniophora sp. CONT]|nr:hypothetical protein PENSPDRAFT_655986 [Peniophora sp. CONT]